MPNHRIVILTQYFPPEMGAPQSRLLETAKGLRECGWEVEIVTALPNYPTGSIFPDYKWRFYHKETINALCVRRFWLYASNSRQALPRILSMISFSLTVLLALPYLIRFRPTFLLVESPPLLLGLSGWFLARFTGARLLLNISDLWPLSAAELGAIRKEGFLYRILSALERFLYRQAYACTGQSGEIVRHLSASGARRAWLYRNGVDSSRFQLNADKVIARPLQIVYAGLLGVAQGIFALCQHLKFDIASVEFHIYGDGAEKDAIKVWLDKHPESGITLHEKISRDEITKMLIKYDITLIPLIKPIYGAVPSKIYEAMAAGLPIIFAGGGEGATIVEDYDLGWVCPPSDFETMQQIVEYLSYASEAELIQKRNNCIRAAQEIFDRNIQISALDKHLKYSVSR